MSTNPPFYITISFQLMLDTNILKQPMLMFEFQVWSNSAISPLGAVHKSRDHFWAFSRPIPHSVMCPWYFGLPIHHPLLISWYMNKSKPLKKGFITYKYRDKCIKMNNELMLGKWNDMKIWKFSLFPRLFPRFNLMHDI